MDNSVLPKALIVHQIRDRARLRIKEKRNDAEFFDQIRSQLKAISVITEVEINCATASILLLHPCSQWSEVETQLKELKLFEIVEHIAQEPALAQVMSGFSKFEKHILDMSSGSIDVRTLAFIVLSLFALRQIMRGEILGPGLTLLWNAMGLANYAVGDEENS